MEAYTLGITATQQGTTHAQICTLYTLLHDLKPDELHHGDCIGGDAQAHEEVRSVLPDCHIVIHPPINQSKRAFKEGDEERKPKQYLDRNKDIVNEIDALIVMPKEFEMQQRSGTWSTYRYAEKRGVPIYLILPDGTSEEH